MTDRAQDEIEIRNLIASLAMLSDDGNIEEYGPLLTEDIRWVMNMPSQLTGSPVPPKVGRDAILAGARERLAAGIQGPGSHKRHTILTTMVTLHGSTASAKSYFALYKNTNATPAIAMFGIYRDEFRMTAEGWRLAEHTVDPA